MQTHFGPTGWWPGETPFEIAVGAILTQNTAWKNVEKSLELIKAVDLLSPDALLRASEKTLHRVLKPAGFFRIKTKRLKHFCQFLIDEHEGSMDSLAEVPLDELRPTLLNIHGIGNETADAIILYACEKRVFVVDAYTRRIFGRHEWVTHDIGYEPLRNFFESRLNENVEYFQEYHGLIDMTAKEFCNSRPKCDGCPLAPLLRKNQPALAPR
jgi:endonuclease-3 related protein